MPGKTWNTWNRLPDRPVVPGVGKRRAIGAALAAVGVVLSGCGTADGDDTTTTTPTTSVAEQSDSPWDLPLEQRPALFDPCAEIPDEAVAEGFGEPVQRTERYVNHKPGELMSCGWESEDVEINILSTWKSRDDYIADRTFTVEENEIGGRPGMRGLDNINDGGRTCIQFFFSERGTIWLKTNLLGRFREFNGEQFADACKALNQMVIPVIPHLPEGDFQ